VRGLGAPRLAFFSAAIASLRFLYMHRD